MTTIESTVAWVRPTESGRKMTDILYGSRRPTVSLAKAIGDVVATKVLAELLKSTVDRHMTSDGRVDWIDVAGDIVAWMKDHQK